MPENEMWKPRSLAHDRERIGSRRPRMDHQRLAAFTGRADVAAKALTLPR
jgi:hypothetical protein